MPTLDANSLLADPAPLWFDDLSPDARPADDAHDTVPGGLQADPLAAALAQVEAARQRPALAVVPPPAADPLAMALPWLVRHLGVAAAVEAVVGPVHEDRPVPSDDVLPALRRIGFDAHLQRRSLASLKPSDLPTVLLLNSGDACVLTARWQDAQGQAQCSVVLPGPQPDEFSSAEAEIDAEYSGVALLVNPPRPPFASALARARSGAQGASAAGSATPPTAEALVALAAAVQDAQRARQPSGLPVAAAQARPATPAVPAPPATVAAQPRVEPRLDAPPLAAPARRAAAAAPGPLLAAQRREPELGALPDLPAHVADDEALALEVSFLQAQRAAGPTPGQALRRIGQDTRALARSSVGLLAGRLRQAGRALSRLLAAARLHGGRRVRLAGLALRRCSQFSSQGLARWLRRAGSRLRQRQQALVARLRQRRHRRQARLALADEALPLPLPGQPPVAGAGAAAGSGGADAFAAQLAQAWDGAAQDEQAALAPPPAPVLPIALAAAAAPAAPAPRRQPAPAIEARGPTAQAPLLATVARLPRQGAATVEPVEPVAAWPALWRRCQQAAGGLALRANGHRWSWMPGLAAGSALCLLVGAPQAWAGMVSGSGLQALQVAPTLLRSAFRADLDEAARAIGQQALARLSAAKEQMDCEAGQPQAAAAGDLALAGAAAAALAAPADTGARPVRAAARAPTAAPGRAALSARPAASRHRGTPRRARHACR